MKSPRFAAISLLLAVVSLTTAVHGQSPALEIRRAGDAIRRGDHAAALRTLRPLRSKHPENADIPRFLALAYGGLGRYDEARAAAIDALSLGRFSPDVLGNLARVDRERDDRVALLNTVRILVVLEPENVDWRVLQADLLASSGAQAEAASIFATLLEKHPARDDLHARLGRVELDRDSPKRAIVHLETAWRLGSKAPSVALQLAESQQRLGDHRSAAGWLERAFATTREDVSLELRLRYAGLLFAIDDLEESERASQRILEQKAEKQTAAKAETLLGRIASRRNRPAKAAEHLERAISLGASAPELLSWVGAHHFNAKEYAKAETFLSRRVDEHEFEEQDLRFLVLSLIRSNRAIQARSRLEQYLAQYGLQDPARRLIEELWKSGR